MPLYRSIVILNVKVEPLLQRYARLRASNFRIAGGHHSTDSANPTSSTITSTITTAANTVNPNQANQPTGRIVMPRPVVLNATGPSPCLLAAVRASAGSSECSELSSITRSIEPASSGCRRCLSHASSTGSSATACGGAGNDGGGGGRRVPRGGSVEVEEADGTDRRPKTEPQAYYETFNSRISLLNSTTAR